MSAPGETNVSRGFAYWGVCVLNSELVRSVGVQSLRAARPLHQSLPLSSR